MLEAIFKKIDLGVDLDKQDAVELLGIETGSKAYYDLLWRSNAYSRSAFSGAGRVFAQIGLDAQPCKVNCKFCSLARDAFGKKPIYEATLDETLEKAKGLVDAGAQELFLMTTANYDKEQFLAYGATVKAILPDDMHFVANVGDFDAAYAARLRETGFTGVYHICRLGEGTDTEAPLADRIATLDAIKAAGLEVYYCVEPIGAEHTPEELVDEMFRAKDYSVTVMAVMKRICVPGTPLFDRGEISAATLAKICAVATLCVRPKRAMGVHEPDELCLMAGANQIYAEVGVNPRDTTNHTEQVRGFSVEDAWKLLGKADWIK